MISVRRKNGIKLAANIFIISSFSTSNIRFITISIWVLYNCRSRFYLRTNCRRCNNWFIYWCNTPINDIRSRGASIPDYASATIIATALVATSGGTLTPEAAITIAIPVGLLLLNFDIFARWSNTFVVNRIESDIKNGEYKKAINKNKLGAINWGLSRFIPVFLALVLGQAFIEEAVTWINANIQWLMDGLTIAGGLLPAVGIAILLKFMPIQKYFYFALLGFLLVAYLGVPITGVALFGLIAALIVYTQGDKGNDVNNTPSAVIMSEEGVYEYDE